METKTLVDMNHDEIKTQKSKHWTTDPGPWYFGILLFANIVTVLFFPE